MEENKSKANLTPVAIIIAGIIISGAIVGKEPLYKLLEKNSSTEETYGVGSGETKGAETKTQTATDKFKEYAKNLGLDQSKFDTCLDSGKYEDRINETSEQANSLGISGTPSFFINGKKLVGAQPFAIFKAVLDKELGITADYPADIKESITQLATASYFSETAIDIPTSDADIVKGDASAKVTVVEFTDYQCPYCARYATDTMLQIQKEYIDTGKIKYILKDNPLTSLGHKNAEKASESTLCANEQGKYWEMHDKIFSTQSEWSGL